MVRSILVQLCSDGSREANLDKTCRKNHHCCHNLSRERK
jgi:hypothetical protein